MVTKTLLFAGEGSGLFAVPPGSGGPMFRAYDKKTGDIVSEFKLPANQSGIPMTYLLRQAVHRRRRRCGRHARRVRRADRRLISAAYSKRQQRRREGAKKISCFSSV